MRSHGKGRGTRMPRGVFSGTTLATIPSGVTMSLGGGLEVTSGVSIGDGTNYWVTYTSLGYKVAGGNSAWAGASLTISHGFTTLTGISGIHMATGVTQPGIVVSQDNGISGGVSMAIMEHTNDGLMKSGGTLFWTAFGT
jgi:hypothetical protein